MKRQYLQENGNLTGKIEDDEIALLTHANRQGKRWMTLKNGTGFFVLDLAIPPSIVERQTEDEATI